MNKYLVIIALIFILIVSFAIFENKKPNVKTSVILSSINSIKELSVVKYQYEKIVKFKKNEFCNITLVVKGNVEGFLDLKQISKDNIKILDSIVYVHAPQIQLRVNILDYRIFKENILFGCDRIELLNSAISSSKSTILQEAMKDGIEEKTKYRVEEILNNLIKNFGFKKVIIKTSPLS